MSASSVTGVGQGSAMKLGTKGADDMYLGVEKLIGPRVVFASSVTLSSGTATVVFPEVLNGVAADYIVMASSTGANHAYSSALTTSGFTMTGTGSQVINYCVVRVNNATVQVN